MTTTGYTVAQPVGRGEDEVDGRGAFGTDPVVLIVPIHRLVTDRANLIAEIEKRLVQEAVRLVMGDQESFDPRRKSSSAAHSRVEDRRAIGRRFLFEGRQEYGLDASRVERHKLVLAKSGTFPCAVCGPSVSKKLEKGKIAAHDARERRSESR